jgi:hypothetical protein
MSLVGRYYMLCVVGTEKYFLAPGERMHKYFFIQLITEYKGISPFQPENIA